MTLTEPSPEQIRDWIAQSLRRSPCGSTLADIGAAIQAGEARLWIGEASAAVTQFVPTERIWHAGASDMNDLIRTMQRAADEMRLRGIERLIVEDTRGGWERVLEPYGFKRIDGLGMDL